MTWQESQNKIDQEPTAKMPLERLEQLAAFSLPNQAGLGFRDGAAGSLGDKAGARTSMKALLLNGGQAVLLAMPMQLRGRP
jgi:hypothetical protein